MKKEIQKARSAKDFFGAEIQYFRLEPRYWEPILMRLKDTGLECVSTYVQWETHAVAPPDKKNPAGVLDFTGKTNPRLNLMRFLDLVEKHGLHLNFRCGPFCCNEAVHGGYPPWLVLGDPSLMVWDYQNRPTQGYWIGKKEGSQPSYLHPEYLSWCAKWIGEVDKIVLPHLKARGGCITMLNLDNEISYIVRDSFLNSDYNPVNVGPGGFYHQFLKSKYGSPQRLPYGRRIASWADVYPPRSVPDAIGADIAWHLDWVEFKTWVMCEYIRRLRAMHEKHGVRDVTFTTNFNPHLPEGVPTRMPDFESAVGEGGVVGYDFYRGAFMSYSGYHSMARVLKLMNASVKYTWSSEFMAGTWNKDMGKVSRVSAEHMRFMARCALAQGCKAINWFMFHDRNCWGDAPVSSHGHARPNLEVLKETPRLLFEKIGNWDALIPQMDVAVIYDLASHMHTAIGDPMPCNDNNNHVGAPEVDGVKAGLASLEYYSLFRLVEQCGMQAGSVDPVKAPGRLCKFPVAFLPGSPVLSRATLKTIKRFLDRGGLLVVSGPLPKRDELGRTLKFPDARRFVWRQDYLGHEKPEGDSLESIASVAQLLKKAKVVPHVRLSMPETVSYVDWQEEGGHRVWTQPRNLGSAILHRGPDGERVLFVLNHYIEAARFDLSFGREPAKCLTDLDTGAVINPVQGRFEVDVDRKSATVYQVN